MMNLSAQHLLRLVTGLILLAVLGLFIFLGGWPLRVLVAVAALAGLYELFSMFWPGVFFRLWRKLLGFAAGIAVILSQAAGPQWQMLALCLFFCALALTFLFSYGTGNKDADFRLYSPLAFGVLYVPCILQLALYLNPAEQLVVVGAAIAADAGGYYAGNAFGGRRVMPFLGPKIWPSVSPKKSWAGSLGGFLLTVALFLAVGWGAAAAKWPLPVLPLWGWACLGGGLNICAQLGDFFESALKRTAGVKDSSCLLPGHGGMLDRIDSLLFVLPAFMLVKMLAGM